MKKNQKNKQNIFSKTQISFFAKELQEAGSFDELMIKKKAVEESNGRVYILTYSNILLYRKIHLIGVYKLLRPYFNTKVPYSFWSQLYSALKKNIRPSK
ncbi:MAG: hypothetical protein WC223_10805 [Bacteroidales bacterium]|jgi:hypothetical protein